MKLIQKHQIKQTHSKFKEIDGACFASKKLFNCAVYICRQHYLKGEKIPTFNELYHLLKLTDDYKSLPAKISQLTIKQVSNVFKSYLKAKTEYSKNPLKFTGKPNLPKYKHKEKGRNLICFNYQAISKTWLKKGFVSPSGLTLKVPTNISDIDEVRIVPKYGCYVVEIVYNVPDVEQCTDGVIASIDIGLNNLATVASNNSNFTPFIVCGKAIKSYNQWYNKLKSKLQSFLPNNLYTSKKIEALTRKRNNKMDYYIHTASRFIVNKLIERGVSRLIIGKNEGWKQNIKIGKRNNQHFESVPHSTLINQLVYKCELVGIKVTTSEESYTSKCSFLDMEPIAKHSEYQGNRVKRGLFKSSQGIRINADLNGSLNILRKVVGDSVFNRDSIERLVVSPIRFKPYKA
ncbi:RNA-guided endonuclease InsQ/TnpB family protein [Calothrix sp. CCY 0018]|uniref:RNA-guided endonuclease InsQ/TnpB family protein n=1 Tax=Calothrix sp. CCY 0018 TaxID=3103864 RepID=UPI0039C6FC6A